MKKRRRKRRKRRRKRKRKKSSNRENISKMQCSATIYMITETKKTL